LATPESWQFIAFGHDYTDMRQQRWLPGIAGDRPVTCELNRISEHVIAVRAEIGVADLPCFIGDVESDFVRIRNDIRA